MGKSMFNNLIFLILISACTLGCAMPRIIIFQDPLTPEEHLNLGVAYEKKYEYDLAIKEYEFASRRLPIAYLYMANSYFQKNDPDEAEFLYRKVIREHPEMADAYNNLAWLLYAGQKNLGEAKALVLKAIVLKPESKAVYLDTLEKIETTAEASKYQTKIPN
jgi:tetratricopeptide (TPR) repeat protein